MIEEGHCLIQFNVIHETLLIIQTQPHRRCELSCSCLGICLPFILTTPSRRSTVRYDARNTEPVPPVHYGYRVKRNFRVKSMSTRSSVAMDVRLFRRKIHTARPSARPSLLNKPLLRHQISLHVNTSLWTCGCFDAKSIPHVHTSLWTCGCFGALDIHSGSSVIMPQQSSAAVPEAGRSLITSGEAGVMPCPSTIRLNTYRGAWSRIQYEK